MELLSTQILQRVANIRSQLSEKSVLLSLKAFCTAIIAKYGDEYLRLPNGSDIKRILHINAFHSFPGSIGSTDCQHYKCKNCPFALAGQFVRKQKTPTVALELIVDAELWIWHAHFGIP